MRIWLKRIYEAVSNDDGYRVLVDRVWPRGIAKRDAALDEWRRELAPSSELRRCFGHDRERWSAFYSAYWSELDDGDPQVFERLRARANDKGLTLVFAARDTEYNNAVVLKDYLAGPP